MIVGRTPYSAGSIDVDRYAAIRAMLLVHVVTYTYSSVHSGKSKGLAPKIWPESDPQGFQAFCKSIVQFAQKCFSECSCQLSKGTVSLIQAAR